MNYDEGRAALCEALELLEQAESDGHSFVLALCAARIELDDDAEESVSSSRLYRVVHGKKTTLGATKKLTEIVNHDLDELAK